MIPWQLEGVHGTFEVPLPGMGAGSLGRGRTLQVGAPVTLHQQGGHGPGQGSRAATGSHGGSVTQASKLGGHGV